MRTTDRFTLAAITVVAVLAACLAVAWTPGWVLNGPLTWAVVYVGAVLGLARATGLPPGRTLIAASLLVAATVRLLLTALAHVLDAALTALHTVDIRGRSYLVDATEVAA